MPSTASTPNVFIGSSDTFINQNIKPRPSLIIGSTDVIDELNARPTNADVDQKIADAMPTSGMKMTLVTLSGAGTLPNKAGLAKITVIGGGGGGGSYEGAASAATVSKGGGGSSITIDGATYTAGGGGGGGSVSGYADTADGGRGGGIEGDGNPASLISTGSPQYGGSGGGSIYEGFEQIGVGSTQGAARNGDVPDADGRGGMSLVGNYGRGGDGGDGGAGGGSGACITYWVNLPANATYSAVIGQGGASYASGTQHQGTAGAIVVEYQQ